MRQWIISAGSTSLSDLKLVETETPQPGPGEVLVRVRACSLNFRDQIIPLGFYMGGVVQNDSSHTAKAAGDYR